MGNCSFCCCYACMVHQWFSIINLHYQFSITSANDRCHQYVLRTTRNITACKNLFQGQIVRLTTPRKFHPCWLQFRPFHQLVYYCSFSNVAKNCSARSVPLLLYGLLIHFLRHTHASLCRTAQSSCAKPICAKWIPMRLNSCQLAFHRESPKSDFSKFFEGKFWTAKMNEMRKHSWNSDPPLIWRFFWHLDF